MFKKVIFLLVLACLGLAEEGRFGNRTDEGSSLKGKIVGGVPAKLGELPHQALLAFPKGICGGSILSEKVVLTVAHCAIKIPKKSSNPPIRVMAGILDYKRPEPHKQVSTIKTAVVHPNYTVKNTDTYLYDIAVLILDKPFTFNQYVKPAALPKPGAKFTGIVTMSGWGLTTNTTTGVLADVLQKVEVPLVDFEACKKKWKVLALNELIHICTGPVGGNLSSCKGDSGGPVTTVVNGVTTVIGVISQVQWPCGHGLPSVHTRVSGFIDFIKSNMNKALE